MGVGAHRRDIGGRTQGGGGLQHGRNISAAVLRGKNHPPFVVVADSGVIVVLVQNPAQERSEEHTSELQSLMRISYAVFCLKKKNTRVHITYTNILHMKL